MNAWSIATGHFSSTHNDPAESHFVHGHDFEVLVEEEASSTGLCGTLQRDVDAVCTELHLRDLEAMLVGGKQTPDGIAAWFSERLLMNHPRIYKVEISTASGLRGGINREPR